MLVALIMAGGLGERFWPLSTKEHPKQVLDLFTGKPMIKETLDRILPIIPLSNIFIATNSTQQNIIKEVLPDFPISNFIIEPMFKDTAAAIGFGVLNIKKHFDNPTIVVLASDHIIKNEEQFRHNILKAEKVAKEGFIVTFGIKPTKPETNYGYIELDKEFKINDVFDAISFREKPDLKTATKYLLEKKYLWNSGMFIFTENTIYKAFMEHANSHYQTLMKIANEDGSLKDLFNEFERKSIDYAIMEKANNIKVIPVDIGWNDVGSYNSLIDILNENKNGSINISDKLIECDSKNNIVIARKKSVSLIGVEDLIIVETDNKILVAKKSEINKIKEIAKNDF
ncbi:hypothetical protein LJC17_02380 [Acholeplasma sp. OttesenSCG-928-E16]|nr:hypothetical protein [Acholeplasma sp. OttesenSCG-928-E16]